MNAQQRGILALAVGAVIHGCQAAPLTTIDKSVAHGLLLKPARFEMTCSVATSPEPLKEVSQMLALGPRLMGMQRAPSALGATGCGEEADPAEICVDESGGCFAADG
jgi:hypothetical protein